MREIYKSATLISLCYESREFSKSTVVHYSLYFLKVIHTHTYTWLPRTTYYLGINTTRTFSLKPSTLFLLERSSDMNLWYQGNFSYQIYDYF